MELDPEDYYFEGETIVFTAAYHVKRGECCESGCRHCPFEHRNVPGAADDQRPGVPPDAPDAG
jgi:Family of unknown function (DUF5522)